MTIAVTCPHCQSHLTLKDEYAGRRGACPKCKGAIQVPTAASEAMSPRAPPDVSRPDDDAPPIHVTCTYCGKVLRGRASMAGKRVKCPGCGNVLALPDAQRSSADAQPNTGQAGGGWFDQAMDDYVLAKPTAAYVPPNLAAANPYLAPASVGRGTLPKRRVSSGDDELTSFDWTLAIIIGWLACILGIIWLIQGNPKGGKMILAVVVVAVVKLLLAFAFVAFSLLTG